MQLKTRKQLRIEGQTAAAALAAIQTPEGLARFMFSRINDEEFEAAFRAEIEKLAEAKHLAAIAEADGAEAARMQAEQDAKDAEAAVPVEEEEAEPLRYQLFHKTAEGEEVPVLVSGKEVYQELPFTDADLAAIALSNSVAVDSLFVIDLDDDDPDTSRGDES